MLNHLFHGGSTSQVKRIIAGDGTVKRAMVRCIALKEADRPRYFQAVFLPANALSYEDTGAPVDDTPRLE